MPTKARIPLPSVLDPDTRKCVQFYIPDDPEWQGMFWGALSQLSVWTAYQRSNDTSGADVASVWSQIIADARDAECQAPCSPVYIDNIFGYNGHTNPTGNLTFGVVGCSDCTYTDQLVGSCPLNTSTGLADQARGFFDVIDFSASGVKICEFRAWQVDATTTNVWNFVYDTCTEFDLTITTPGTVFVKRNFVCQRWGLSSLAPYAFIITWEGPEICTSA